MIKYQCGYKYQLSDDYRHSLPESIAQFAYSHNGDYIAIASGVMLIRKGYAWDGPSGPSFDTKTFMRGSLVHDALYQLMREHVLPRKLKSAADEELRLICIEDGMMTARAWWCHRAVTRFGIKATIANKDIMVAP